MTLVYCPELETVDVELDGWRCLGTLTFRCDARPTQQCRPTYRGRPSLS